jgi:site-specific recombinase XerD
VSRSMHAEQSDPSPYNHHLQQFLTFLKQERGFAEATMVNRKRSLKPFLAWLLAQGVPLSGVSLAAITKYFTSAVAGRWKRTSISFHVQSLRSFFPYAGSRGWSAAGIAESIDAPRLYTYENLPQGPSWEDVKKLIASVNGTSPVQIRSRKVGDHLGHVSVAATRIYAKVDLTALREVHFEREAAHCLYRAV